MSPFAVRLWAGMTVLFAALSWWKLSLLYGAVTLLCLGLVEERK